MKSIDRRLYKLEGWLGVSGDLLLVVLSDAGRRGLDGDVCVEILHEGAFLPGVGVALVDLSQIQVALSAKETEEFVRVNSARICGSPGI